MSAVRVVNGLYILDEHWSAIERKTLNACVDFLTARGFVYRQIPSTVAADTYVRQGISDENGLILGQEIAATGMRLAGSAEQGILQCLIGQRIDKPLRIVAHNTCFRAEPEYQGIKRLREFQKVEQYMCVAQSDQDAAFEEILENALQFMNQLGVTRYRLVDRTQADPGYHIKKTDIEVWTEAYGWMETHSCSKFGTHQADRYDITGPCRYTLSNTGAATPRLLVPLMEQAGLVLPL